NQDVTKAEPKPNQDVTKTQPKPNQDVTKAEPNKKENKNVNVKENANVSAKKSMYFYFQNIGGVAPATATEICSFIDDGISDEMILYALQKAVDANAKNWKYAKAIINSWVNKGLNTLEQVKAEDVEFKNRKNPIAAKKEFPQHEYTQEQREQRKMDAYAEMEKIAGG
ncbi:MAG: DnaD domain protein, partial [Christensenellaceae bacterium]